MVGITWIIHVSTLKLHNSIKVKNHKGISCQLKPGQKDMHVKRTQTMVTGLEYVKHEHKKYETHQKMKSKKMEFCLQPQEGAVKREPADSSQRDP